MRRWNLPQVNTKSNVRSVDCCYGDDRIYSMRRNNICGHGERSK